MTFPPWHLLFNDKEVSKRGVSGSWSGWWHVLPRLLSLKAPRARACLLCGPCLPAAWLYIIKPDQNYPPYDPSPDNVQGTWIPGSCCNKEVLFYIWLLTNEALFPNCRNRCKSVQKQRLEKVIREKPRAFHRVAWNWRMHTGTRATLSSELARSPR